MKPMDHATKYGSSEYRTPDGAPTDVVIFTITSAERLSRKKTLPVRELRVLLIERGNWPFANQWALPGGFALETESIQDCAKRQLREETGVDGIHIEYFNVYSEAGRDPRGWMISHAFFALVNESFLEQRKAADDAAGVKLVPVSEALEMKLAFDHNRIVRDALEQIRRRMLTTTIAKQFLPDEFTMSELYQVIETVVPDFVEKNFIRKINSTQSRKGILEVVRDAYGQPKGSNRHSQRTAQLYRFTDYQPQLSIYS